MSRSSVILRNIASNWAGFAVNAIVTLALTPYVVGELGVARYGVWILTSGIIGYYGLLDVGFRAGVTQYLTRYLAARDYLRGSECLSSAIVALGAFGLLLTVLSVVAGYAAPTMFDLPADMENEAFWCILIVGLSAAVQFAFSPFASIFTATQRFDLANLIGVATRLLTAASIFAALWAGYGLIGVSAATCSVSLIDYLIRWRVALRLAPELRFSLHRASLSRLREVFSFGAWNFLISISAFVATHVPALLIGVFMPVAAVGHFALAMGLYRQINSVLSPVGQVIYPAAAKLHVQGDQRGLERLYHDGSRFLMLVMIPLVLVATFWAEDFYTLWIGAQYLSGVPYVSVAVLFQILMIGTAASYLSNIAAQVLIGAGRVRLLALALIGGSLLNLALSLTLIGRYGLAGVAVAIAAAAVIVDFIVVPILLQNTLGLSVWGFLRGACVRPLIAGVLQAALMVCIRLSSPVDSWGYLLAQGLLAGVGCVVVVLLVGVSAAERQRFVLQPLRRCLHKASVRGSSLDYADR